MQEKTQNIKDRPLTNFPGSLATAQFASQMAFPFPFSSLKCIQIENKHKEKDRLTNKQSIKMWKQGEDLMGIATQHLDTRWGLAERYQGIPTQWKGTGGVGVGAVGGV